MNLEQLNHIQTAELGPAVPDLLHEWHDKEITIRGMTGTLTDLADWCPKPVADMTPEERNDFVVTAVNESGGDIEEAYAPYASQLLKAKGHEVRFTVTGTRESISDSAPQVKKPFVRHQAMQAAIERSVERPFEHKTPAKPAAVVNHENMVKPPVTSDTLDVKPSIASPATANHTGNANQEHLIVNQAEHTTKVVRQPAPEVIPRPLQPNPATAKQPLALTWLPNLESQPKPVAVVTQPAPAAETATAETCPTQKNEVDILPDGRQPTDEHVTPVIDSFDDVSYNALQEKASAIIVEFQDLLHWPRGENTADDELAMAETENFAVVNLEELAEPTLAATLSERLKTMDETEQQLIAPIIEEITVTQQRINELVDNNFEPAVIEVAIAQLIDELQGICGILDIPTRPEAVTQLLIQVLQAEPQSTMQGYIEAAVNLYFDGTREARQDTANYIDTDGPYRRQTPGHLVGQLVMFYTAWNQALTIAA